MIRQGRKGEEQEHREACAGGGERPGPITRRPPQTRGKASGSPLPKAVRNLWLGAGKEKVQPCGLPGKGGSQEALRK